MYKDSAVLKKITYNSERGSEPATTRIFGMDEIRTKTAMNNLLQVAINDLANVQRVQNSCNWP